VDVLIVDNDRGIAELVAWFLEQRGHSARSVQSFVEARHELRRRPPDLMLSDIEMGVESGREELPRLAAEGLLPPTLVVSGFLDAELRGELEALPAIVGVLAKPFDLADLEARVDTLARGPRRARPLPRAAPAPEPDGDGWIEVLPLDRAPGDEEGR